MLCLSHIRDRRLFGNLLRDMGSRYAVEVGTHRGAFAVELVRRWKGFLYCVDPWSVPIGYEEQSRALPTLGGTGNRDEDYEACKIALFPWTHRVSLLRDTSPEAASKFTDKSLDFVYIDADHSEDAVYKDLVAWYPKLILGGIIAGHDFLCPNEIQGGYGKTVQPAVMRFAHEYNLDIYLVVEETNLPWSFYLVRG